MSVAGQVFTLIGVLQAVLGFGILKRLVLAVRDKDLQRAPRAIAYQFFWEQTSGLDLMALVGITILELGIYLFYVPPSIFQVLWAPTVVLGIQTVYVAADRGFALTSVGQEQASTSRRGRRATDQEPTMEDILANIRAIIAEDEPHSGEDQERGIIPPRRRASPGDAA